MSTIDLYSNKIESLAWDKFNDRYEVTGVTYFGTFIYCRADVGPSKRANEDRDDDDDDDDDDDLTYDINGRTNFKVPTLYTSWSFAWSQLLSRVIKRVQYVVESLGRRHFVAAICVMTLASHFFHPIYVIRDIRRGEIYVTVRHTTLC